MVVVRVKQCVLCSCCMEKEEYKQVGGIKHEIKKYNMNFVLRLYVGFTPAEFCFRDNSIGNDLRTPPRTSP